MTLFEIHLFVSNIIGMELLTSVLVEYLKSIYW